MTSTSVRLWTQEEYHRMTEAGILDPDERVKRLEGQIISMAAKNPPHSATNLCAADYLRKSLNSFPNPLLSLSGKAISRSLISQLIQAILLEKLGGCICC